MKKLYNILGSLLLLASVFMGIGYTASQAIAALQFVQTPTITLYASISGSATSMRLTPYPRDLDGNKLTMTDFGTSPTVTVDPKVKNVEEIVGFTGIVDNGDNTATLTGLTRDLISKAPYTTVGTGRAHAASAIAVFSNNPQMYARFAAPENTQTWTGIQTFTAGANPTYSSVPSSYSSTDFVAYQTLLATAIQGAGTSTESTMGLVQLASNSQAAAGTASSTQGRPLVLGARLATSTCQMAQSSVLIASSTTGKLSGNCFDATYPYNFTGTTSIAASGTTTSPVKFNGVTYAFPPSQGASSTVLNDDGQGDLTWILPPVSSPLVTASYQTTSSASTTLATAILPANTLGTTKSLSFEALFDAVTGGGGNCQPEVQFGNGSASTTIAFVSNNISFMYLNGSVFATTTNSALGYGFGTKASAGMSAAPTVIDTFNFLPYNLAATTYIAFRINVFSGSCGMDGARVTINRQ